MKKIIFFNAYRAPGSEIKEMLEKGAPDYLTVITVHDKEEIIKLNPPVTLGYEGQDKKREIHVYKPKIIKK